MVATNQDVLSMLSELITLTTLDEGSPQSFKVRAYEKAALALQAHGGDITKLSAGELIRIDGVGKATATKIRELVDTGSVEKVEKLREKFPPGVVEMSRIPGMGPKTVQLVRSKLGIENVEQLKEAVDNHQLRALSGMGPASEAKIAKAIERLGLTGKDHRTPIGDALPLAERLVASLEVIDGVVEVAYCGSLRRMAETVGDIDITVAADHPDAVMNTVRSHPEVDEIVVSGDTKTSFLTRTGLQVDVRVVTPSQFGAAVLYFTGSKAHNIELRQRAIKRGLLLNEYGLFTAPALTEDENRDDGDDGPGQVAVREAGELVASETEQEIYAALDLPYIPPPLREATGETDGDLPDLIQLEHIRGDLHYHTDRSGDGRSTVAEMVAEAAGRGYAYLAITDHGENLAINGSTAEEMLEHREVIATVAANYPAMTVMWGCELNIGPGGDLDYTSEFRHLFDYTVASVHSHFDLSVEEQTRRLIAAIEDPTVDSIGHLTGRYIGRRPGIELDIEKVLDALVANDVALEINGALKRLDAASDVVRRGVDKGVKLVINTDSHHISELGRMEYGVLTAQRGWAPRELVVNSWDSDDFFTWLSSRS